MDEDDFRDDSIDDLEDVELENNSSRNYGKKARELNNKRKSSNAEKPAKASQSDKTSKASQAGKKATSDTVKKQTSNQMRKETSSKVRRSATKEAVSAGAAAATGGTSKAAEIGIETALKASDKIDQKVADKLGVSKGKIKAFKIATIISLPLIVLLTLIILIVTIFDLLTTAYAAKEMKSAIESVETELGKSLIRFTDSDFRVLIDHIHETYELQGYPTTSYLGKLITTYESDDDKSNIDKALEVMEKYFRTEKLNFNKIKWAVVNGENGEKKTPLMYETFDRLQLPKTDEDYFGNGVFPALPEDGTIDTFKGYLQTWSIPMLLHISTGNAYYAQNVMDQMYNEVSAQVYLLNKYTKNTTVALTLETESYEVEVTTTNEDGTTSTTTETRWKVKEPYVIKSVDSSTPGTVLKSPDSVATFINYAETYKGIVSSPVILESKSPSTYTKNEGAVTVIGTATASGIAAQRIDVETWKDLASQEEEVVQAYTFEEGKTRDELTINRVQAYMENPMYAYEGIKYPLSALQIPFSEIDKIHFDALQEVKSGTITKDVWIGDGLAWPVPEAVTVGYYFHDPKYTDHTGIDISNEGKIINGHGPEIVAAADGKVIKVVKGNTGYGHYVDIEHENGLITRYAHLASIENNIKVNYKISEGTKIGYMGTTGNSSGIHLHFEVIEAGVQVDPMQYYLYKEKQMTYNNEYKTVYIYTGRKQQNPNVNTGNMMFTDDWNQAMSDMIAEALDMASTRPMVYNQGNRPIEIDTRPTSGDCSSFVANLYYRYFNHAFIGGNSTAQYDMLGLKNIKAIYVEDGINSDGTINTAVVKPGDVIVNRSVHSMLYVGEIGGRGVGSIVDHGNGNGPKVSDFYHYNLAYRTSCKVIRYYTDAALINTGGGVSLGGLELGGSVPSAAFNATMRYFDLIERYSEMFGLDPYLVVAMICAESSGNPSADNGAAAGLMQIEYRAGANTQVAHYVDGRTETLHASKSQLFNPDINIKMGCAQLRNRIDEYRNNILVAIQGYNYGPGGIARCIGYSLSNGSNTGDRYCGKTMAEIKDYAATFDTKWLQARGWYTSTGWTIFGGGGGTRDYLERVLKFYDSRGGSEYPFTLDYSTKQKIYFGKPSATAGVAGEFPKYRQFEGPWSQVSFTRDNIQGNSYRIAATACGPSSTAIILSGLGVVIPGYDGVTFNGYTGVADGKMDPGEVAKFFIDNNCKDRGVNTNSGTNSDKFGRALQDKLGNVLDIQFLQNEANKAYDMIANQGYVAVANSNTQGQGRVHFTGGGHYIAIVGVEDGKFKVIDPGSSRRDGTSCPGCGYNCGNAQYNPSMMSRFGSVSAGGIRRWLMIKVK